MSVSAAAAAMASPGDDTEVRVAFFTRRPEFVIPDTPVTVPGRLRRAALSVMINHLLQLDPQVTFDFLVAGEFLRTSLSTYIDAHNVYKEEILKLEVVEAMPPPMPPHEFPHDDWIAGVAALPDGTCLTGCYDHAARVWNSSGELVVTLTGHTDAVTGVAWVPQSESIDSHTCVSSSFDENLRLWNVDLGARTARCVAVYEGHTDAVTAVAIQPTGKMFASASADRDIKLWTCTPEEAAEPAAVGKASGKRRRVGKAPVEKALGTLSGSAGSVASVCWPERGTLYSGGHDQCVRVWDVESGQCVRSLTGARVVNAVAASAVSGILASADFDGCVRLYDPRGSEGSVVKVTLTSHKQPSSSVAWCPSDANLLVSGSYDGPIGEVPNNLKLWDIRSKNIPLHNLGGHEDKVLSVAWPSPSLIAAGGADGRLRMHTWASGEPSAAGE